jgi:hypothetical protein
MKIYSSGLSEASNTDMDTTNPLIPNKLGYVRNETQSEIID